MRQRKYRIRPHSYLVGKWRAEYSYLGVFWSSVEQVSWAWDQIPMRYETTSAAEEAIEADIKARLALAAHRAKGSYRYP